MSGCGCGEKTALLQGTLSGQVTRKRVMKIEPLNGTELASTMVEVIGAPEFVSDLSKYAGYSLTEPGWYAFARVYVARRSYSAPTVSGAAGYIVGSDHVDLAVKFAVAAETQVVTINWGSYEEEICFKATDLAVRNLDYRTTFYVYDADEFATWEFGRMPDATFIGTQYYTEQDGEYTQAAVKALEDIPADTYYTHEYVLTDDTTFQSGKTYYTKTITPHSTYEETAMRTWNETTYDAAEVTEGEEVPANTYYVDQWTLATGYFEGKAYYIESDGEYTQVAVKAGEVEAYFTMQVDYDLTEDETYVGTEYWEADAESDFGYSRAAVKAGFEAPAEPSYYTHSYLKLTTAGTFAADKRYFKLIDGVYELQEVTPGASYAKNVYYTDNWTIVEAGTALVGTRYYSPDATAPEGYTQVDVVAGEAVQEGTFVRTVTWPQATDQTFAEGVTYYINPTGNEYVEADVTEGDQIPAYFAHTNITFSGMTHNVTYRFNQIIDCPSTFILPEVEDETHGCWYELRLRHADRYSVTLVPPSEDIRVATEHTQAETKGINMINLHYASIAGAKVWRFMNTHSSFTA